MCCIFTSSNEAKYLFIFKFLGANPNCSIYIINSTISFKSKYRNNVKLLLQCVAICNISE